MANEKDIIFKLTINGTEREIKTMGDLKKAAKDAKSELAQFEIGTKGFDEAQKKLQQIQGKINDIGDAAKVEGTGVERLGQSFGLLAEGAKSFDGDKLKLAFNGVGQAMKAIPIFLIIEGITYLVQYFDELSKGSGILGKSLRVIGDLFSWIGDKITEFTDLLGLSNSALDKQGEAIKEAASKGKEALDAQTAAFDRQIAVAKAAGKSTVALEIAKQQAIIDTNYQVAKQIEAFVRAGGVLDDEKKKLLTASLEAIKNARTSQQVAEITDTKAHNEALKKLADDRIKAQEKLEADARARKKTLDDEAARDELYLSEQAKNAKINNAVTADAVNAELLVNSALRAEAELKKEVADAEAAAKLKADRKLQTEDNYYNSIKGLSDLFFNIQLNNAKGNAAKELELKKKQFEVEKAFSVARTVIDVTRSVQATLASGGAFAIPLAVSMGILGAVNVAKILSTQFNSGASAGVGSVNIGGGGSSNIPLPPSSLQAPSTQPTTTFNSQGQNTSYGQPVVKAVVVETEMTNSQSRVNKLTRQSQYG